MFVLYILDAPIKFGRAISLDQTKSMAPIIVRVCLVLFMCGNIVMRVLSGAKLFTLFNMFLFSFAGINLFYMYKLGWTPLMFGIEAYRYLYWFIIFLFFFTNAYQFRINNSLINKLLLPWFFFVFFQVVIMNLERAGSTGSLNLLAINAGYIALDFLPLFLILNGNKKGLMNAPYFIIVMIGIVLLVSLKRGAILSYLLGVMAYIGLKEKIETGSLVSLFRTAFKFGIMIILLAIPFLLKADQLMHRFADTTGSGRTTLYKLIYDHWLMGSLSDKIFGYGYISVKSYLDAKFNCPIYAHSDFLEYLHDYGLLGISIYVCIHLALIHVLYRLYTKRHWMCPVLGCFYVIFLCRAIYSGVFAIGPAFALGAMFLGLLGGYYYKLRDLHVKKQKVGTAWGVPKTQNMIPG
ncbi:O-antigen ligase family protein [Syntrophus gentianae]|nr:O-antigen ligase family protein [Syntrophus gentianae]